MDEEKKKQYKKMLCPYMQEVLKIVGLPNGMDGLLASILMLQSPEADANGLHPITLTHSNKRMIAEENGLSIGSVNNRISMLAKSGLLMRGARGKYYAHPNYFGTAPYFCVERYTVMRMIDFDGVRSSIKILLENEHED